MAIIKNYNNNDYEYKPFIDGELKLLEDFYQAGQKNAETVAARRKAKLPDLFNQDSNLYRVEAKAYNLETTFADPASAAALTNEIDLAFLCKNKDGNYMVYDANKHKTFNLGKTDKKDAKAYFEHYINTIVSPKTLAWTNSGEGEAGVLNAGKTQNSDIDLDATHYKNYKTPNIDNISIYYNTYNHSAYIWDAITKKMVKIDNPEYHSVLGNYMSDSALSKAYFLYLASTLDPKLKFWEKSYTPVGEASVNLNLEESPDLNSKTNEASEESLGLIPSDSDSSSLVTSGGTDTSGTSASATASADLTAAAPAAVETPVDTRVYYTYGDHQIDLKHYLHNLNSNLNRFLDSRRSWSPELKQAFRDRFALLSQGLQELLSGGTNRFTTDTSGITHDANGMIANGKDIIYVDGQAFDVSKELGNFADRIAGAITTKGLTKEYYDKQFQAKVAAAERQQAAAQRQAAAALPAASESTSDSTASGAFDPATHTLAALLKLNGINSASDFNAKAEGKTAELLKQALTSYKEQLQAFASGPKDRYIQGVDALIAELDSHGLSETAKKTLKDLGLDDDFIGGISASYTGPELSSEGISKKVKEAEDRLDSSYKNRIIESKGFSVDDSSGYTVTKLDEAYGKFANDLGKTGITQKNIGEHIESVKEAAVLAMLLGKKEEASKNIKALLKLYNTKVAENPISIFVDSGDGKLLLSYDFTKYGVVLVVNNNKIYLENASNYEDSDFWKLGTSVQSNRLGGKLEQGGAFSWTKNAIQLLFDVDKAQRQGDRTDEAFAHANTRFTTWGDDVQSVYGEENGEWSSEDSARVASFALNMAALVDPEGFSSAGLGLAGSAAEAYADWNDESLTTGDKILNTVTNVGLDAVGLIPVIGSSAKFALKGTSNLVKGAKLIMKGVAGFGILNGVANAGEIWEGLSNVASGNFSRENLMRAAEGALLLAMAVTGGHAKWREHSNLKNSKSISIPIKKDPKGEYKMYEITDEKLVAQLKENLGNPEKVTDLIRKNLEGFEKAEISSEILPTKLTWNPLSMVGRWKGWHNSEGKIQNPVGFSSKVQMYGQNLPYAFGLIKPGERPMGDAVTMHSPEGAPKREFIFKQEGQNDIVLTEGGHVPESVKKAIAEEKGEFFEKTPDGDAPIKHEDIKAILEKSVTEAAPAEGTPEVVERADPEEVIPGTPGAEAVKETIKLSGDEAAKAILNSTEGRAIAERSKAKTEKEISLKTQLAELKSRKQSTVKLIQEAALEQHAANKAVQEAKKLLKTPFKVEGIDKTISSIKEAKTIEKSLENSVTSLKEAAATLDSKMAAANVEELIALKEQKDRIQVTLDTAISLLEQIKNYTKTRSIATKKEIATKARTRQLQLIDDKHSIESELKAIKEQLKEQQTPSTGLLDLNNAIKNNGFITLDGKIYEFEAPEEIIKLLLKNYGLRLKKGGVLKFDTGGAVAGIGLNGSWENTVGQLSWNRILLELAKNRDYYKTINDFQTKHATLRAQAHGNWNKERSYLGSDNAISDYLTAYQSGGWNETAIAPNFDSRYDFSGSSASRYEKDRGSAGWQSDNLYAGITDDRRLLGRYDASKGDSDDYGNGVLALKNEALKLYGLELYLDLDGYYKIKDTQGGSGLSETSTGTQSAGSASEFGGETPTAPIVPRKGLMEQLKEKAPHLAEWAKIYWLNKRNKANGQLLLNATLPFLQDPYEVHRLVYGNLRALQEGAQAAALLNSMASRPQTSDGSLLQAMQLEAAVKGLAYVDAGNKADDLSFRETAEKAWQLEKDNVYNNWKVAMANRLELNSYALNKAKIKNAINAEVTNNINTQLDADIRAAKEKALIRKKEIDSANLHDIEVAAAVNPKALGLNLSHEEQRVLNAVNSGMSYSDFDPADRPIFMTVRQKLKQAASNYMRIYNGLPTSPFADAINQGMNDSWEYITNPPTETFKEGGLVKVAKIREKIKNADRALKNIHKRIDSLDRQLDRVQKSMKGPVKIAKLK